MSPQQFSFEDVPLQNKCRWFVRLGTTTEFGRVFRSKEGTNGWVNTLGHRLVWRVGHVFRLRGVAEDLAIVNRRGEVAES